ncbi:phage holin family protein [Falsiroseomonas bella]|uniref:Phage holin family protein n=1 Tax=Falsiroseomonas bella TaxID=2184016 RepID=A0A317F8V9_9PROT|nr:phage holin family protein [Falsiroseomonas bella]PWS34912.1 phage holin family protein [Falsiroseomonas bella]
MSTQYDPDRVPPKPARAVNDDARALDTRSVPELLADMVNQLTLLFRKEVQLARAEMGEKASEVGNAIPGIAGGAGLAFGGLILMLFAAAAGISAWFDLAAGWGLLIVGVLAALIGYALVRAGASRLKATNLTPHRTAEQLSRDAQAAKEQVR